MALHNCKSCGKLIGETPSGYCDACKATDPSFSNLHKVKDYLYDNPNTNITTVSQDTGVSVSEISRYIREGALIEISGVSVVQGNKCACGNALEGSERTCKTCKREAEKSAERVKKELSKSISKTTDNDPIGKTKIPFFTKHH